MEKFFDEDGMNSSNVECTHHTNLSEYEREYFTEEPNARKAVRRKRENFPTGAPVFVETAVFVDRDLFDLMKNNFPMETERELIRFVLAMINAVSFIMI